MKLTKTGHPEHDAYRITGTPYIVTDTGNGGDTAYALYRERFPGDDNCEELATGPTLKSVIAAYHRLA